MIDARRQACLDAMGIQVWVRRQPAPGPEATPVPDSVEPPAVEPAPESRPEAPLAAEAASSVECLGWDELTDRVAACNRCPELVANRSRTVFGVGNREAELMVIGEAPGAEEDRRGEPFVGRAGKLLDNMLYAAGFPRPTVFIANILKCRPPRNRDPAPHEADACAGYLRRQIELTEPRVILVVGRVAAQNLLGTDQPTGRLRGKVHHYADTDIPVVATYHPAYLLRSPAEKRKAWEDLRLLRRVHGGRPP